MADHSEAYCRAMERLVAVVQELSTARDLETVMVVVRGAARELTGAEGATFVLRDNDQCFYAEENAIAPLWKGRRFPMTACISGWTMLNREAAVIEDIYADPRIPVDAWDLPMPLATGPGPEDPVTVGGTCSDHRRSGVNEGDEHSGGRGAW